jgi:hypothetical protein
MRVSMKEARHRLSLALVGTLALLAANCGLDKVKEPPVQGPSETGVSVAMYALPDILNADGVSTSAIQLVLRMPDGTPLSGRAVNFYLASGDGRLKPSPSSTYVGPIQTGFVMATDTDGVANVVYVAGRGIRTVSVAARPYGSDATNMDFYRTVEILQQ